MIAVVCALTMNGSPRMVCTVVVVIATLANTVSKSLCFEESTLPLCSIDVQLTTPLTLLVLLLPQFFKLAAFLFILTTATVIPDVKAPRNNTTRVLTPACTLHGMYVAQSSPLQSKAQYHPG